VPDLTRRPPWTKGQAPEVLLGREWLVANGLGGYASGTVAGVSTRRYHALLVAALPAPLGRVVLLDRLEEVVRLPDGSEARLGGEETEAGLSLPGADHLADFRLEAGLPVWRYELGGVALERRVVLVHLANVAHVSYRLLEGKGPVRLELSPFVHVRRQDSPLDRDEARPYRLDERDGRCELGCHQGLPALRMRIEGARAAFVAERRTRTGVLYRFERAVGYEHVGELESPGRFQVDLEPGAGAALVAGAASWEALDAQTAPEALASELERRGRLVAAAAPEAREGVAAELVLAADSFIIEPVGRPLEAARAHAVGDEARTVIAGYPWFGDWGRDTMISLEGLALATGRAREAASILRAFARHVQGGLIPNMFPDGTTEGLYNTADATLWMFHAIARYVLWTGDRATLRALLPVLEEIVARHVEGTRFGIGVDPADGLLRQGAPGVQLTWMDAKVGDWVVTPRRGKAVEINALWYNALRHLAGWLAQERSPAAAAPIAELAARAGRSFNERFWSGERGHLLDVVDGPSGDDPSLRPNQVLAIALDHPVLARERWESVLDAVRRELLTPVGLRTLAPGHPDYKRACAGDLETRDAAYHQGTVWAWLMGPFVDAWLRARPDDAAGARSFLRGLVAHLDEACVGSVSEIFDAERPYAPRGCFAQAWSVAELLRSLVATERARARGPGAAPEPGPRRR
jgi:predicted glycogen debranching enzyme